MNRRRWTMWVLLWIIPSLLWTASCTKKAMKEDVTAPRIEDSRVKDTLTGRSRMEGGATIEEGTVGRGTGSAWQQAQSRFLSDHIYFAYDSAVLSQSAQKKIRDKADWLRSNPQASVIIEGHCDERGTTEYNLALGDRRANSVKRFLMNLGIQGSRMTTVSFGEERPIDPGHNESAWSLNRRAQFVLR